MLNEIIDTVRLDINKSAMNVCIYVRMADTRTLEFILMNNGSVIDVTEALTTALCIQREDEDTQSYQAMTRIGNKLRYTLHDTDVAEAGTLTCMVIVTFEDSIQVSSPTFAIIVEEPALNMSDVLAQSEYSELGEEVELCSTYAATCNEAVSTASTLITDATELISQIEALETEIETLLENADILIELLEGADTLTTENIDDMWDGTWTEDTDSNEETTEETTEDTTEETTEETTEDTTEETTEDTTDTSTDDTSSDTTEETT